MKVKYQIRAAQLDLARQPETMEFIRDFIDFIKANHYNTLFLYLEWRVRTRTFDIGKDGYTAAQLKEITDYAGERGIEVIPGLAALGHAELVLEQKKFESYAELRDGVKGRFDHSKRIDFCPSKQEVKDFIASYFTEVSKIFKSEYIHIGGDEVWDIGYCPQCRERAATYEGEQRIYLEHFAFVHKVVKKLGKRTMLWDDMFEYYPDILPEMPRDMIMVNWQYQSNVTSFQGHFTNLINIDLISQYEKLGIDYLIAPADYFWSNTESFTNYTRKGKPLGGLVTTWEKSVSFLYKSFPFLAASGQLWGGAKDGEAAMAAGIKQIFGNVDEVFGQAVRQFAAAMPRVSVSLPYLMSMARSGPDYRHLATYRTLHAVLKSYEGKFKNQLAQRVLRDMTDDAAMHILAMRCRIACWHMVKGLEGESIGALLKELDVLAAERTGLCRKYRGKQFEGLFKGYFESWRGALVEFREGMKKSGILSCEFCLPDTFGAERITIEVKTGGKYQKVGGGVFKDGHEPLFEYYFFIPKSAELEAVRISAAGFAGQGVCYVSAVNAKGNFVPDGVTGVAGIVEHPEHVLTADVTRCWLGSQCTIDAFHDRSLGDLVSSIAVSLKKESV